ncbi:MAG: PHP domain-containing protein [Phycisphaerae bacterium]|jgi:hypothetical protein
MSARRWVDLHTHSTASDGSVSPQRLLAEADAAGLAVIALTDHDTTEGLAPARQAAAEFPQLRLVSGIEVSAAFAGGTMHILGLGIDENAPSLQALTREMQAARAGRNPRIIAKLQALGLAIDLADVLAQAGGGDQRILGRLHIAQTLAAKGHVRCPAEAFDRYLGDGGPAAVPKDRWRPRQVIDAIHGGGGIAMLAHPSQLRCANRLQLERVLRDLAHAGLDGIEVYHPDHSPQQTRLCLELATKLNLLPSGGSDFHGLGKPAVQLGHPRVSVTMIERTAERLAVLNDE